MRSEVLSAGADAAEDILRDVYRVDISKVLDPTKVRDFVKLTRQIRTKLLTQARPLERSAMLRALRDLEDTDWTAIPPLVRNRIIFEAADALGAVVDRVLPRVNRLFEAEAVKVIGNTKKRVRRRFRLTIDSSLTEQDLAGARAVLGMQTNFIRDEFGRRRVGFSKTARDIVSDGLEKGLGSGEISKTLASRLRSLGVKQSENYWQVVSMSFLNHARTFSQLSAFDQAGIETYRWDAVLDEATTDQCRFMHDKRFRVAKSLQVFQDLGRLKDPDKIKVVKPWMRVGVDDKGNQVMFVNKGDRRIRVANIAESAVGEKDEIGRYTNAVSTPRLESLGVSAPPLHGLCRSTITAEV